MAVAQQKMENIDHIEIPMDLTNNCPGTGTGTGSTELKTLPLHSPSEWSYDALTRSLNTKESKPNSFYKNTMHGSSNSIISLLNEMEFSPLDARMNDVHSQSISDISSAMRSPSDEEQIHTNNNNNDNNGSNTKNLDPNNRTQMTAGLLLLFISGILDAGSIAYVNWLYGVGFTLQEIFMFQGIVQVILCFAFGIITVKLMIQSSVVAARSANQLNQLQTMRMRPPQNITLRSLVLPFSVEYNATFAQNVFTNTTAANIGINTHNYGSITMDGAPQIPQHINRNINTMNWTQLLVAMLAFGVVASASHLTYFIGYLKGLSLSRDHYEIAPLFNSLAVGFVFLWSYVVYNTRLNPESLLYLFLMYVGMIVCGYSFMKHIHTDTSLSLILNMSNVYLICSAFLDSLGYILIKYASNIPTFVLVLSQSVFCAISGVILFETSPHDIIRSALNERSFSNVIEVSSVGLIGFASIWCFIRGTQLISIGTASFIKMTIFVIFSIVIQVFSIDGKTPHFYCIFGLCLISLSIVLMLCEKFAKFK